jgi:cytochrome c oxidase subunit 1
MFGRKVSEFWGKMSFWLVFIGFNVTFFPMHFLGLRGMPRRTYTYDGNMGWAEGNMIATIGAFILALGVATYFITMVYTYYKGEKTTMDPWDGRTLEWMLPNPPPEYNFQVIPTVHARDGWWYAKQHKEEIAKEEAEHKKDDEAHGGVHMPHMSIWPFMASFGILIGALGVAVMDPANTHDYPGFWGPKVGVTILGGAIMFVAVVLWSLEGADGYHIHLNDDGSIKPDDGHGSH